MGRARALRVNRVLTFSKVNYDFFASFSIFRFKYFASFSADDRSPRLAEDLSDEWRRRLLRFSDWSPSSMPRLIF